MVDATDPKRQTRSMVLFTDLNACAALSFSSWLKPRLFPTSLRQRPSGSQLWNWAASSSKSATRNPASAL
eukprot:5089591-Pyramimonas_sp.AAC.1